MTWFAYFSVALIVSFAIGFYITRQRNKKSKKCLVRLGGIAMIVAFLVCVLINPELVKTPQIVALMFGVFLILFFGLVDDIKNLSWKVQLAFQLALVFLLIFSGYSIDYLTGPRGEMIRFDAWSISVFEISFPIISIAIIFLWTLSVMNAINWADGIDGLAGGIGIVGALALFWISLTKEVNQPAIAIIAIIFLGSVLGFWWLNFPKARIEAGTSGSYFIGFVLASTAIIAGTKIATAMIVLAIPLVDLVWVVGQRIKRKSPITKKDLSHLHHKLRSIGWSNSRIVTSYLSFIALMFIITNLTASRMEKFAIIGMEIILIILFLFFVSKKQQKMRLTKP